ncbi:Hypothetical protein A7982_03073 [Minicystis rosea]|nr:Hypothetical protein A7982_03073 [Minicystis rosea]
MGNPRRDHATPCIGARLSRSAVIGSEGHPSETCEARGSFRAAPAS